MRSPLLFKVHTPMLAAIGAFLLASHVTVIAGLVSLGIFGRGFAAEPALNLLITILAVAFFTTSGVVAAWYWYKAFRTVVTGHGVTQPTVRGHIHLEWTRVDRVKLLESNGIRISGPEGDVTIPLAVFRDRERVLAFVMSRLPDIGISGERL